MFEDPPAERARQRLTATWRALPWLQIGIEHNPAVHETGPLVNIVALSETETRPAVLLGTSSDRIGTPSGRGYYVTVSKSFGPGIAPYAGAFYGTYEDRLRAVGGLYAPMGDRFSALVVFDGKNVTPSLTWEAGPYVSISALAFRFESLGATLAVRF